MASDGKGPSRQDPLEEIAAYLPGLRKDVRRLRRGELGLAVAVVAAVLAVAGWLHHQDDVRASNHAANLARVAALEQRLAATQTQNTLFRERICASIGDWREYLRVAPAGPPAGRAAAGRLVASLKPLCPKSLPGG